METQSQQRKDVGAPDIVASLDLHEREVSKEEIRKFEGYVGEIFAAFGMNMNTTATDITPQRFVKALYDSTEGYEGDPKLLTVFPTECNRGPDCNFSQVIEGPIHFTAFCEHHVLPFYGHAYVGYIAHGEILGISKLTRLVRVFSKRFTVQERIGQQIVDALQVMLQPHGVGVFMEAHHLCTQMRGVREIEPQTRTTFWRGAYEKDPSLRSEFLAASGAS